MYNAGQLMHPARKTAAEKVKRELQVCCCELMQLQLLVTLSAASAVSDICFSSTCSCSITVTVAISYMSSISTGTCGRRRFRLVNRLSSSRISYV